MLDFIKIEFGLLSAQKRKVRIYIFLHLFKGKKLSCPLLFLSIPVFGKIKISGLVPDTKRQKRSMKNLKQFVFS